MSCLSTEELAGLYDGVFSRENASRLRDHLAMCQRCCNEFDTLVRLRGQSEQPSLTSRLLGKLVSRAIQKRSAPKAGMPGHSRISRRPRIADK